MTKTDRSTRRADWLPALAVFFAGGALSLLHGDIGWDSTWVLQVVSRLQAGDVLYRDVYAGVPPLPFTLARAATAIFGVELVVLKLLVAATVALSWLFAARILRNLIGSGHLDWPLAAAMIACALPDVASLYQPLANLFLLIAIAAAQGSQLADRGRAAPWIAPAMAGAACALSGLSKQTVGVYATLAVLAIIAALRPAQDRAAAFRRWVGIAALSGLLVVTAILMPVVLNGSWLTFLNDAFGGKATYLRVGGVPYFEELGAWIASTRAGGLGAAVSVANGLALIVPVLGVAALAFVWLQPRSRPRDLAVVASLALAELASLYPRADLQHVIPLVPGLLVTMGYAWAAACIARPSLAVWLRRGATVVVLLALAVRGAVAAAAVVDPERTISAVPHLRGLVMRRAQIRDLERDASALRAAAAQEPLFLMVPNAGLYYLISGIRNPTPFDYPLVTAFGRTGQTDTIARLDRGDLRQVCMKHVTGLLTPDPLQSYIDTRMIRVADLGVCDLYRR